MRRPGRSAFALLLLFLVPNGAALAGSSARPAPHRSPERVGPKLDRQRFKAFAEAMVARKAASDVARALAAQGFGQDEIDKVMNGPALARFQERVVRHTLIQERLDAAVRKLYEPERAYALQEKMEAERRQRAVSETALQLQKALRDRQLRRQAPHAEPQPAGWERLWRLLRRHLLE